ncbi:MAG: hypothetical protein VB102_04340 [Paludibacter sp.]|nr:hypothetical protein [Paludibacter sp.]
MKTKKLLLLTLVFGVSMSLFSGTYTITQNDVISLTSGYVNNMNEVWNVQSTVTDKPLKINYLIGTEFGHDYVIIKSVDNQGIATTLLTLSGTKSGFVSTIIPNGKAQIIFTSDGSVSNYGNPNAYLGLDISFTVDNDNIIQNNLHTSGYTQTDGNLYVNGKIGLGTTVPIKKLEIVDGAEGKFSFSATSCTSGYEVAQTINNTGYKLNVGSSARDYRISLNGNDKFIINSAGRVGIGTVYPSGTLDVFGNNESPSINLGFTGANQSACQYLQYDIDGHYMQFGTYGPTCSGTLFGLNLAGSTVIKMAPISTGYGLLGTRTATPLVFATSNVERVRFAANGNVGVGSNAPLAKLHINSGPNNNYAAILATSNEGNNLVVSSHNTQPHSCTVFKISHEYSNNPAYRNNGYIAFHRGSSVDGGFLEFGTNGLQRLLINSAGNVGIGTSQIPDTFKLAVAGKIIAEEVVIKLRSNWSDYVFKPDYYLMPLHQVEQFVTTNNHLPGIPSAAEVQNDGLSMGEMQNKLLQKIEELTLYIIEQDKKIKNLEERLK